MVFRPNVGSEYCGPRNNRRATVMVFSAAPSTSPSLQGCDDARLADRDALLLHGLVDRSPILLVHLSCGPWNQVV